MIPFATGPYTKNFVGNFHVFLLVVSLLTLACDDGAGDAGVTDGDRQDQDTESLDGDIENDTLGEMESDFDGDQDPDGDAEALPEDPFDSTWWEIDDPSGIRELLETSQFFQGHEELVSEMSTWFDHVVHLEPGEESVESS